MTNTTKRQLAEEIVEILSRDNTPQRIVARKLLAAGFTETEADFFLRVRCRDKVGTPDVVKVVNAVRDLKIQPEPFR